MRIADKETQQMRGDLSTYVSSFVDILREYFSKKILTKE